MKKVLAIISVLVGVVGICAATCCLPCGTPPPEAPPVVLAPADASAPPIAPPGAGDDAAACAPPDAGAGPVWPIPPPPVCVPRKDVRALCAAARLFCGP